MKEIYNNMAKFAKETFSDATVEDHLEKLKEEANEAITEPGDLSEFADCQLALISAVSKAGFSYDEFINATKAKFEVLKTRKWTVNNGVYQHIK